jgi:hypothetical protein
LSFKKVIKGKLRLVHPDDTCRNAWMNNQFGSELGPSDCIGASVELDEDEVCALDDD